MCGMELKVMLEGNVYRFLLSETFVDACHLVSRSSLGLVKVEWSGDIYAFMVAVSHQEFDGNDGCVERCESGAFLGYSDCEVCHAMSPRLLRRHSPCIAVHQVFNQVINFACAGSQGRREATPGRAY